MVLNEGKKQENKKEKLTESLRLTVKIAKRSNHNIDLRNLGVNKRAALKHGIRTPDSGNGNGITETETETETEAETEYGIKYQ